MAAKIVQKSSANIWTKVGAAYDNLEKALFAFACFLVAFSAVATTVAVVMRYFLHNAIDWLPEINVYTIVYITFLSAAWLQRKGWHIHMDTVVNRFGPKGARVFKVATSAVGALLWLTIAWFGGQMTWTLFQQRYLLPSIIEPLKAIIIVVIPFGSLLLGIELVRDTYALVTAKEVVKEKVETEL